MAEFLDAGERKEMLESFMSITASKMDTAEYWLEACNFNMDNAVGMFFANPGTGALDTPLISSSTFRSDGRSQGGASSATPHEGPSGMSQGNASFENYGNGQNAMSDEEILKNIGGASFNGGLGGLGGFGGYGGMNDEDNVRKPDGVKKQR